MKNILRELTSMALEGYHDLMKAIFARSKHKMVAEELFQLDENEMVVKWKALLHTAKTPGMSADPFFLFILSNMLRRPIVMHGQRLSVPVGKTARDLSTIVDEPGGVPPDAHCGGGRNLAS